MIAFLLVQGSSVLSPIITLGGIGVGLLTIVGFFLAARAYMKAKSIDSLNDVNKILRAEIDALSLSRDRMDKDLIAAQATILAQGEEIKRLSARTDLAKHQDHLDKQHAQTMKVLTRIADESALRNGGLAELINIVISEGRERKV